MKFIQILFTITILTLTGCASSNNPADPFEPFNRGVFKLNDTVDKAITKPIAQGYNKVMPETGKILVYNFFSNLNDVIITANDLLQFKLVQAFSDGMRFFVNTTIGVGGLIDVASMHLEKHNEDFGQTLGYWGVGNGPYLVVPILGPSTLRDSIGDFADGQVSLIWRINNIPTRNQLYVLKAVKRRAELLGNESLLEGVVLNRYSFIRDAYLQRRLSRVYDGNPPHDNYEDELPYPEEDHTKP